jgi:hypothetical protein
VLSEAHEKFLVWRFFFWRQTGWRLSWFSLLGAGLHHRYCFFRVSFIVHREKNSKFEELCNLDTDD